MKKVLSILLILMMIFTLAACGGSEQGDAEGTVYKVGMVCIGDDNAAYDRNFYQAADKAKEQLAAEGINIEWIYKYNEAVEVAEYNEELAAEGCVAIFNNSYGQEPAMLTVAADYPETIFVGMTNEGSKSDNLDNTINGFPSIQEARYLSGIAAGCKLQEMIDNGEITEDEAIIGYVGAFTYAEVISGYTSLYLGAKEVCPSVKMKVEFIGSWGDPTMEANTAQDLIDRGCTLIAQHTDSTTPATTAQENGLPHIGYNISMIDVAPEASIVSCTIDWTNFMVKVIKAAINGETPEQDYFGHGLADGDVCLTELNTAVATEGTQAALDDAKAKLISGELKVFDTTKFTVGGKELTSALVDMDADFTPDEGYDAVFEGEYHESYFKSAPAFDQKIDGIELVNEAF